LERREKFLMIFIVAKFNVRPEYSDTWLERVRTFTEMTRQEPGNLWFEWSRSMETENEFVLVEAFRDGEAGAAHVKSEHFKRATSELPQILTGVPDIVNVEAPGSEWSKLTEMGGVDLIEGGSQFSG
jgi:quinol monooxygenase YgiN